MQKANSLEKLVIRSCNITDQEEARRLAKKARENLDLTETSRWSKALPDAECICLHNQEDSTLSQCQAKSFSMESTLPVEDEFEESLSEWEFSADNNDALPPPDCCIKSKLSESEDLCGSSLKTNATERTEALSVQPSEESSTVEFWTEEEENDECSENGSKSFFIKADGLKPLGRYLEKHHFLVANNHSVITSKSAKSSKTMVPVIKTQMQTRKENKIQKTVSVPLLNYRENKTQFFNYCGGNNGAFADGNLSFSSPESKGQVNAGTPSSRAASEKWSDDGSCDSTKAVVHDNYFSKTETLKAHEGANDEASGLPTSPKRKSSSKWSPNIKVNNGSILQRRGRRKWRLPSTRGYFAVDSP
jgi:hypothetical protein